MNRETLVSLMCVSLVEAAACVQDAPLGGPTTTSVKQQGGVLLGPPNRGAPAPLPPDAALNGESFTAEETSPEAVAKAQAAFEAAARAFQSLPAVANREKITVFEKQIQWFPEAFTAECGPDNSMRLNIDAMNYTVSGGKLYMNFGELSDTYLVTDLKGSFDETVKSMYGRGMPVPDVLLREGSADPAGYGLGFIEGAKPSGFRIAEDGSPQALASGKDQDVLVTFDANTHLPKSALAVIRAPRNPMKGLRFKMLIEYTITTPEKPEPIVFKPGNMRQVSSEGELFPSMH